MDNKKIPDPRDEDKSKAWDVLFRWLIFGWLLSLSIGQWRLWDAIGGINEALKGVLSITGGLVNNIEGILNILKTLNNDTTVLYKHVASLSELLEQLVHMLV